MSDKQLFNTYTELGAAAIVSSKSDVDFTIRSLERFNFEPTTIYRRGSGNEVGFNEVGFNEGNFNPATIYKRDEDGDTLLHLAIIFKKSEQAIEFISKAHTQKHLSIANRLFQTPLHLAVITDQPEVVRNLVIAEADMMSQDRKGNTVLHIACHDWKLDVLTALLETMQTLERRSKYDIDLSSQTWKQVSCVKNYEGFTCFHLAALNGYYDILDILIKDNIDMNLKEEKSGRTVLHRACENGDIRLVKFLLSYGACDTNVRTRHGCTPFNLARDRGHEDVCVTLAAAGAGKLY